MKQAAAPVPRSQASIGFVLAVVVVDAMAIGMIYPVLPRLVQEIAGSDQSTVATYIGILGFCFFALQFIAAPIQGALSDAFGRRPVLLLSSAGMALDYVAMALAPSMLVLMIGRAISGAAAGNLAAAGAYLVDVTPEGQRARVFALSGAAFYAGASIGPALGGLVAELGPRAPFWLAAGISLCNTLFGALMLRESLAKHQRKPFHWSAFNPLKTLSTLVQEAPRVGVWALPVGLTMIGLAGVNAIFAVYLTYRFEWSPRELGVYIGVLAVSSVVIQGLLMPLLTRRLREETLLIAGAAAQAVAVAGLGLSTTGEWYVAWTGLWLVGSFANSNGLFAVLTRLVSGQSQGALQGGARSLESLAGLIAPVPFALVLSHSPDMLPGAPYMLAAALFAFAAIGSAALVLRGWARAEAQA